MDTKVIYEGWVKIQFINLSPIDILGQIIFRGVSKGKLSCTFEDILQHPWPPPTRCQ